MLSQIDTYRRYFSITGLCASALLAAGLLVPRSALGLWLLRNLSSEVAPFLKASGIAAFAYLLAAPRWANVHVFWQSYFLPFCATSLLIVLSRLRTEGFVRGRPLFRFLFLLAIVEIAATSGYMVWLRHTREEPYAIRMVRYLESTYLSPSTPIPPG